MQLTAHEGANLLLDSLRASAPVSEFADVRVTKKGASVPASTVKTIILSRLVTSPQIDTVEQIGHSDVYTCSAGGHETSFTFRVTASPEYHAWFTTRVQELDDLTVARRLFLVIRNLREFFDRRLLAIVVTPELILNAVRAATSNRQPALEENASLRIRIHDPANGGTVFSVSVDGIVTGEIPSNQGALIDLGPLEQDALDLARDGVDAVASDRARSDGRKQALRGQGFEGSAALRTALEDYSMAVAKRYYAADHYALQDVHTKRPYDLIVSIQGVQRNIEVKGTRGDGSQVLLTAGEVREAQANTPRSILFIVHGIDVDDPDGDSPKCSGGTIYIIPVWTPDRQDLDAYRYFYRVPPGGTQLSVGLLGTA